MELSLLCDVKVFLCLFDHNENRFVVYQSEPHDNFVQFDFQQASMPPMRAPPTCRNFYTNDDYKSLFFNQEDDENSNVAEKKQAPKVTLP